MNSSESMVSILLLRILQFLPYFNYSYPNIKRSTLNVKRSPFYLYFMAQLLKQMEEKLEVILIIFIHCSKNIFVLILI